MKKTSLRAALVVLTVLVVLALPARARSSTASSTQKTKTRLIVVRDRSQTTLVFLARHHWMVAPRHDTCWQHVPWSKLCNRARRLLHVTRTRHDHAVSSLQRLEQRELQLTTGSYLGAVSYVERFFGPQAFLRACPNGEGGFGRWVSNTGGSGAGGWLQFMSGTFYGIIDSAIANARAAGMRVPASARSWYSPLGQALAGRQMLADGRRGEWTGANC